MQCKAELIFKDRIGIVANVSARLAEHGFNIHSMEVVQVKGCAHVYVDARHHHRSPLHSQVKAYLREIPGLKQMRFISTLPHEERQNRLRVVFDNISDGVFSIDPKGRITTVNRAVRRALNCEEEQLIGKFVRELTALETNILDCLEGNRYSNIRRNLMTAAGRFQYLSTGRPIRDANDQIIGAVEIDQGLSEIKKAARSITETMDVDFSDIIGEHPAILAAIEFAQKIAATDTIISLRGESGTGKELFARAIHKASGRKGAFVPVNCAALPEQLLESELFGYVGGAYTGGRKEGKAGLFESAADGTLFLDEIAEMPMGSQAKILRVIQDKRVRRIGGTREIPANARIVTATNRDLERRMEENQFRKDLYYRINILPLFIPPLRERLDDIPLLVEHFLFQLSVNLEKGVNGITPAALARLRHHDWPGNVRELKNVVERAFLLSNVDQIDEDTVLFGSEHHQNVLQSQMDGQSLAVDNRSLKEKVNAFEKHLIRSALKQYPSVRHAARVLGITHPALLYKMKKHHLKMVKNPTD